MPCHRGQTTPAERMTMPTSPYSPPMCLKFITWRQPWWIAEAMSWWNASGEARTTMTQWSRPSESLEQACFDWMSGRETETWSCTGDACMSQKTPSMAGCDVCNHCKSFPMQKLGKLTPNWIPTHCWEVISVHTIIQLPKPKQYTTI